MQWHYVCALSHIPALNKCVCGGARGQTHNASGARQWLGRLGGCRWRAAAVSRRADGIAGRHDCRSVLVNLTTTTKRTD